MSTKQPLFSTGLCLMTSGAMAALENVGAMSQVLLYRHTHGDWGSICDEDREQNEWAVKNGGRIMSVYEFSDPKETIWVITEADRSSTTILLPEEY